MQRLQSGSFFTFVDHLAPAKVTRILPEDREPGKRIIALNQFIQTGNGSIIQLLQQNTSQPLPFTGECLAHQLLECGVAGTDDFMFVEPDNQFCGDKAGCHIAVNNMRGL